MFSIIERGVSYDLIFKNFMEGYNFGTSGGRARWGWARSDKAGLMRTSGF